jgi:hypothetical protein
MNGEDDDNNRPFETQRQPSTRRAKAASMVHPNSNALRAYAEGPLDGAARMRISRHLLICAHCSAEFEEIETEKELEPSLVERIRMLMRLISRRTKGVTGYLQSKSDSTQAVSWPKSLPVPVALGLGVLGLGALALWTLQGASHSALNRNVSPETEVPRQSSVAPDQSKQLNDAFQKENSSLHEEMVSTTPVERAVPERLVGKEKDQSGRVNLSVERGLVERRRERSQIRVIATLRDTCGIVLVSSDGTVTLAADSEAAVTLSPSMSQVVGRFITGGVVTPTESARSAQAIIQGERVRGELENARGSRSQTPIPLSPVLGGVRSRSPTLRWEPINGAQEYKVIVAYPDGKASGKVVFSASAGTQSELRLPASVLKRGQVYLWQVEAIVEDQSRVSTPAGFWILSEGSLREVERAAERYSQSRVVLASVYAAHGLHEEALESVKEVLARNQDNSFAQTMLKSLRRLTGKN